MSIQHCASPSQLTTLDARTETRENPYEYLPKNVLNKCSIFFFWKSDSVMAVVRKYQIQHGWNKTARGQR